MSDDDLFIYLGFTIAFNTEQDISLQVVLWTEESSTYSWPRFCTGGGGQRFVGDSNSPVSIVSDLKLISVLILKEPYSIEKCATCLDIFLRF